ncbi:stabilization of polarity axis-domain-containing protein [Limtongia smithiae]|uniref:stabilization of polarity axis-domain-containing protein n=1 Tax=Limtongia smithiae TaxID=1125753 RepID=UPI0034CE4D21
MSTRKADVPVPSPLYRLLAALMLPDQAHSREQDWTVFFSHNLRRGSATSNGHVDDAGRTRLYFINLVNSRRSVDAKRGARVRALALATPHPFVESFKPLLLLAMTDLFPPPSISTSSQTNSPTPSDTLKKLYDCANNFSLAGMPNFTPAELAVLAATPSRRMFVESFPEFERGKIKALRAGSAGDSAGRGGNFDTHFYESKVRFNALEIPMRIPVEISEERVGGTSLIPLLGAIVNAPPRSLLDRRHAHLTLSSTRPTHALIVLLNAIITEKRVLFLGHGRPTSDVVDAVLAACALASSGCLRGFTARALPYAELGQVDDVFVASREGAGYIAGATNPTFASHPGWWDVLCDLSTGEVRVSSEIARPDETQLGKMLSGDGGMGTTSTMRVEKFEDPIDVKFIEDLRHMLAERYSESIIRDRVREYVYRFLQIAVAYDELHFPNTDTPLTSSSTSPWPRAESGFSVRGHGAIWSSGANKLEEINLYAHVIQGWKATTSYKYFISDMRARAKDTTRIRTLDAQHQLERLRRTKLSPRGAAEIYIALRDGVSTAAQITELLALMPEHRGGLEVLAFGLFHRALDARMAAYELLLRISLHPAGYHFYDKLNMMFKAAFVRMEGVKQGTQ